MIPDCERCPPEIVESLQRYVSDGVPTGDFLRAVLSNDLKEAIGRADHNNLPALIHIVAYCYNHVPAIAWGSERLVDAWIGLHVKRREKAVANA